MGRMEGRGYGKGWGWGGMMGWVHLLNVFHPHATPHHFFPTLPPTSLSLAYLHPPTPTTHTCAQPHSAFHPYPTPELLATPNLPITLQ